MIGIWKGHQSVPVDWFEHGLGRTELVEEHGEDALEGHRVEVVAVLLVIDADADHNAEDLVQQVDLGG